VSTGALFRRTKGQTAQRKKETADLYGPVTPVASAVTTISRTETFFTEIRLAGFTDASGTVTITGTDEAGSPQTVVHAVDGNGRYVAVGNAQDFRTITLIETSGLADETTVGTIRVRAVSEAGQLLVANTILNTFPVYLSRPRVGELLQASGNVPLNSSVFFVDHSVVVDENDLLVIGGSTWEVKAVITMHDRNGEIGYHQIIAFAQGQN
jgi:hypothetical protein